MAIQSVVNVNLGQVFSPPSSNSGNSNVVAEARPAPATDASQSVAQQAAPVSAAVSAEQVRDAAEQINKALQNLTSSNLEFSVDDDTGQTVVRVVDIETKDVIRQIPNEETLAIAKSLDKLQGLLIQQKA